MKRTMNTQYHWSGESKKMALPVQQFSQCRCPGNVFFIGTTAVALTKVHVNPTKVSFSSLASASDENEKHFAYLESNKIKKGTHQRVLYFMDFLLVVLC